nr:4.9 kDa non-structural protein [Porcine hemagglutinating encephalomyelitis virus]
MTINFVFGFHIVILSII